MDVILLERISKLGNLGDVVKVKPGYARNYLLPQGKALRATDANREYFEQEKSRLEEANARRRTDAEGIAAGLENRSFVLIRQAGESGQLYGSVNARDIADAAKSDGFSVERNQVVIDRPIKELGLHDITIAPHPEIGVTVTINVAQSAEEAEMQAERGIKVGEDAPEELAAPPAPIEEAEAPVEQASTGEEASTGEAAADGEETAPADEQPAQG